MRSKFKWIFTLTLAFIMQFSFAQEKTVSGTITEGGLPLPGVNVVVKGTTRGTQTDFDGKYAIKAKVGEVLEYTYISMKTQTITVGASNTVNVVMAADATQLGEVVLTADYGYFKRDLDKMSAGVSTISSEEISRQSQVLNITNSLQGKAAGVQVTAQNGKPGQGAFVSVRGAVSITGSSAGAVYVVDGAFVSSSEASAIAPGDVENVTVLKDAVSAGIYGVRGGNGVVVITTKRGKNSKAKFEYNNSFGWGEKVDDNFTMMNAEQKIRYEREDMGAGPTINDTPEQLALKLSYDNNWQDTLLRKGFIQTNNFSYRGGNENLTNYFSLGYSRNEGIIKNLDGYQRITGRYNSDYQASKIFKVGFNVGGSYEIFNEPRDRNNVQNPFRAMYDYNPYETVYARDPATGAVLFDNQGAPVWNIPIAGFPIAEAIINNPEQQRFFRIYGRPYAQLNLSKNLVLTTKINLNYERRQREYFNKPNSILDQIVGDPQARGSKTDSGWDSFEYQWTNLLNYTFSLKEAHNFNVTGMYEYYKNNFRSYTLTRKGFVNGDLPTQGTAVIGVPSTSRTENSTISYFGQLDYDYKGKYLLSGVFRRDGSSLLGVNDKWSNAKGGSAGWVLTKDFLKDNKYVNFLKLRASYGELNSTNGIGSYTAQSTFGTTPYAGVSATTFASGAVGNPDLKFEKAIKQDYGFEARLFNNRVNLTSSYFNDLRKDFIYGDYFPFTTWTSIINAGDWVSKGVELEVRGSVIKNDNSTLTLYFNGAQYDRKINKLARPNNPEDQIQRGLTVNQVGFSPDTYFLTRYAGVDPTNGHALYYKLDGTVTDVYSDDDNVLLEGKTPYAKYEGGFGMEYNYKGFSVAADFSFKQGNYVYNYMWFNMNADGAAPSRNQAVDMFDYWTPTNTTASNPAPRQITGINSNQVSDRFLQDASYIRFRSLNFGYTFDKKMLGDLPIDSVRLFSQIQNLGLWTKYKGDPEVGIGSGESQTGGAIPGQFALYSYPNLRTFVFGLNVNF